MAVTTDPDDRVRWTSPARATLAPCPLCRNAVANEVFLEALHADASHGFLDVATCAACASAFFPTIDDVHAGYPDTVETLADPKFQMLVRHYVELVSGVEWKVSLAERLDVGRFESVLEIGCNVGVFLDYCRVAWDIDPTRLVGVEPSAYGAAGAELLGVPIVQAYLAEAPELTGRTFDCVVATEVLEHVEHPVDFLREVCDALAPDGVAMITTPRAASLTPETPLGELYAALSTGAHRFLASGDQLRSMVTEAGFGWCHIEPFGMTNVAFLADRPVEVNRPVDHRSRVASYHLARSDEAVGDERMALADAISAYCASRASGATMSSDDEQCIEQALAAQFDITLEGIATVVERMGEPSLFGIGRSMPFHLPAYLFWRGQRDDLDDDVRTGLWESAAVVAARGLVADPVNLFVYVDVLRDCVHALAGRPPGRLGAELRRRLPAIPAASGLEIVEPSIAVRVRNGLRRFRNRLRS